MGSLWQHTKDLFTMPVAWAKNLMITMVPFALYYGAMGAAVGAGLSVFGGVIFDVLHNLIGAESFAQSVSNFINSRTWDVLAIQAAGVGAAVGGGYGFVTGTAHTLDEYAVHVDVSSHAKERAQAAAVSRVRANNLANAAEAPLYSRAQGDMNAPSNRIMANSVDYDQKVAAGTPPLGFAR